MKHIADRLEIAQGNNNAEELIPEAIAMLRQQQAKLTKYELRHAEQKKRIEELEKEVKHWQDAFHKGVRL